MRRLLLVVVLLLLVGACGEDETKGELTVSSLDVTFDEPLSPGPVTWRVELSNTGKSDLELEFSSGQRADVTLSKGDETVYQWSRGQMFSQVLGTEEIPAGDERVFELEDVLDVDPGEYELEATITEADGRYATTRTVTVVAG